MKISQNIIGKLDEKDELDELIKNFGDIGSFINEYRKKDPALDLKQLYYYLLFHFLLKFYFY